MHKKHLLIVILSVLSIGGCSTPQGYYQENSKTPEQNDNVAMETYFENQSNNINSTEDAKKTILDEYHESSNASLFLNELKNKGTDLSVINEPIVNFMFDSDKLSDSTKKLIEKHSLLLKSANKLKVILEGHTDSTGDRSYNLKLGERRALAVKNYALSLGVDPKQIEVISYGEEKPLNKELNDNEKQLNRRAVFVYQ